MLNNCARSVWIAVRLRDLILIIPNDIVSDILRKVFDNSILLKHLEMS